MELLCCERHFVPQIYHSDGVMIWICSVPQNITSSFSISQGIKNAPEDKFCFLVQFLTYNHKSRKDKRIWEGGITWNEWKTKKRCSWDIISFSKGCKNEWFKLNYFWVICFSTGMLTVYETDFSRRKHGKNIGCEEDKKLYHSLQRTRKHFFPSSCSEIKPAIWYHTNQCQISTVG